MRDTERCTESEKHTETQRYTETETQRNSHRDAETEKDRVGSPGADMCNFPPSFLQHL